MDYYISPPGELSRTAVIDVGLKCTHSCKFCYYAYLDKTDNPFSGMRKANFRPLEDIKTIIAGLKSNGFKCIDITGGEPALHPDIVEIVRFAEKDADLRVRIITLGQFLTKNVKYFIKHGKNLLERLIDAGVTNFLFSLHAHNEDLFRELTGESLNRQLEAHNYLKNIGFQFTTNTAIVQDNYKYLPDIAKIVVKSGSYMHNFIFMNAYYEWNKGQRSSVIQSKYKDVKPYIEEAVSILEEESIACNIRYLPLCQAGSLSKYVVGVVGVRYDPYEWMNAESHSLSFNVKQSSSLINIQKGQVEPYFVLLKSEGEINGIKIVAVRGENIVKVFPEVCKNCFNIMNCDGYDPKYIMNHGIDEITPMQIESKSGHVLLNDRLKYMLAHVVKYSQYANIKDINKRLLGKFLLNDNPLVSIIIVNFNYKDFVFLALKSVLSQSYINKEIIIVDDNSTDGSFDILSMLPKVKSGKIRLVKTSGFGQPALSRNFGRTFAKGDLLCFLDADDEIKPNYIAEAVKLLNKNPDIYIAYPDSVFSKDGYMRAPEYDYAVLIYSNQLVYCSVMRKEVFDAVGGFRDNVRGVEDWDFWIAAGARGFFAKRIPQAFLFYRQKNDGIYEKEVKCNIDKKFAQIILNNREIYGEESIRNSCKVLGVDYYKYNFFSNMENLIANTNDFENLKAIIKQSGFFDEEYYLSNNYVDIRLRGMDPLGHYLIFGWREGKNPSPLFSTDLYLLENSDVKDANINPLLHYILYGQKESRKSKMSEYDFKNNNLERIKKIKEDIDNNIKTDNKTILIVRMGGGIGDYILFRNFIKILKDDEHYRDYRITFLGNPKCKNIAEELDGDIIDNFIWIGNKQLVDIFYYRQTLIDIVKEKSSYEIIINPIYDREDDMIYLMIDNLIWLLKAKEKIAGSAKLYLNGKLGDIAVNNNHYYTKLIKYDEKAKFEFYRYKEFFEKFLCKKINIYKPEIQPESINDYAKLSYKLPEKFVLLFIGAGDDFKKWSIESFARIGEYIKEKYNLPIVLCGGVEDVSKSEMFSNLFGGGFLNLVGKTSIKNLIDLASRSHLIISNETSFVHLAVAVNAKNIIVIFNGNNITRFVPYPKELLNGTNYHVVFHPEIESNIDDYIYKYGGGRSKLDINQIGIDVVIEKVKLCLT